MSFRTWKAYKGGSPCVSRHTSPLRKQSHGWLQRHAHAHKHTRMHTHTHTHTILQVSGSALASTPYWQSCFVTLENTGTQQQLWCQEHWGWWALLIKQTQWKCWANSKRGYFRLGRHVSEAFQDPTPHRLFLSKYSRRDPLLPRVPELRAQREDDSDGSGLLISVNTYWIRLSFFPREQRKRGRSNCLWTVYDLKYCGRWIHSVIKYLLHVRCSGRQWEEEAQAKGTAFYQLNTSWSH